VSFTALYVAITPPTYTAQSMVLLDPRQSRITETQDVLAGIGSDNAAIASQVEVLRSTELLGAVFASEGIARDPEFSRPSLIGGMLGLLRGDSRAPSESAIFENFRSRVSAQRQGQTYVIDVRFRSENPDNAARIVNAIVKRYAANEVGERNQASADASKVLENQIAALREKIYAAENAVEAFKAKHGIVQLGEGRTLLRSQIDKFSEQLLKTQEQARLAENRYQQVLAAGTSAAALGEIQKIVSSSTIDELRKGYHQRNVEFARAQAAFGKNHPEFQLISSEMARFENLIRAEVRRIITQLKAERDLANSNVTKAEAELARMHAKFDQSNQEEVELRQLEREAEASGKVLEQFLRRTREIGEPDQFQRPKARVISAAVPPDSATWPKPMLLLSGAGAYGLALGVLVALFMGPPAPRFPDQRRFDARRAVIARRAS
ncbi:MAG: GumC family protein, partial [Pseudorhodoplanes sp.]